MKISPGKGSKSMYQVYHFLVHYNVSQNKFYSIQTKVKENTPPSLEVHLYAKSVPLVIFV